MVRFGIFPQKKSSNKVEAISSPTNRRRCQVLSPYELQQELGSSNKLVSELRPIEPDTDDETPENSDLLQLSEMLLNGQVVKKSPELTLYICKYRKQSVFLKRRYDKLFWLPSIDDVITKPRCKFEIKAMRKCQQLGIAAPKIFFANTYQNLICFENIESHFTAKQLIEMQRCALNAVEFQEFMKKFGKELGRLIQTLHCNNIIHGSLKMSKILLRTINNLSHSNQFCIQYKDPLFNVDVMLELVIIDFGSAQINSASNVKAFDLFHLKQNLCFNHKNIELLMDSLIKSYLECGSSLKQQTSDHFKEKFYKSYNDANEVINKFNEYILRGHF